MKTLKVQGRHGDLLIQKIDQLPDGVEKETAIDGAGNVILAHSESGHHHVMTEAKTALFVA